MRRVHGWLRVCGVVVVMAERAGVNNWSHCPFLDSYLQSFKVDIVGKYVCREHRDLVVVQGPSKSPPRQPGTHGRLCGASEEEKEREGERGREVRESPENACRKCRSAGEAGEVVEMSEQSEKAIETEACNIYIY